LLDREKNALKYIFVTHFTMTMLATRLCSKALRRYRGVPPVDRPIIEDPMLVTRRENITRFGTTPEAILRILI
jgi:hypothetical protein